MQLDQQLAALYERALSTLTGSTRLNLKDEQAAWEEGSGGCWDRIDCIRTRYSERIAVVKRVLESSSAPSRAVARNNPEKVDQPSGADVPSRAIAERRKAEAIEEREFREQFEEERKRKEATEAAQRSTARELIGETIKLQKERDALVDDVNDLRQPDEQRFYTKEEEAQQSRLRGERPTSEFPTAESVQRLRQDIADLQVILSVRRKRTVEVSKQTLVTFRQKAASSEIKALEGPLADSSADLTRLCDELERSIKEQNAMEVLRKQQQINEYFELLEGDRKLLSNYLAWESRRRQPPPFQSGQVTAQGITLGATWTDVAKALSADNPEKGTYKHLTIGGQKRATDFTFTPLSSEALKAVEDLRRARTHNLSAWALARLNAQRRLIKVQALLDRYSESYVEELRAALGQKYRALDGPTAAERERFDTYRVETQRYSSTGRYDREPTRFEHSLAFDATQIAYFYDDYKVWLQLARSPLNGEIGVSIVYVDAQTANDVKARRQAAKPNRNDF